MENPGRRALENTHGLLKLRAEVERWEAAAQGDPLTAHHGGRLAQYVVGLRTLAGATEDRVTGALLAALALGPRGPLPGAGDLGPLLEAASETGADVVDLAIAWGCGWRRPVVADHEWHGRWVAAVLALSCLVVGPINRTVDWLEAHVSGVGGALRRLGAEERAERFNSHAQQLAMELSLGACRCRRGATCGRPDHALVSWRPEDCHLPAFVATAVRGSPALPLRAGAFSASMLAEPLREDRVVRVDVAEFHVCDVCNADLVGLAGVRGGLDLGRVTGGLHDVNRCPDCGTLADPGRTYQVARKNWFVVPDEWGGPYEPVRRHRCSGCGSLFAASGRSCPLCRREVPSGHRLTSVWVRRSVLRREAHGS